MTEPLEPALTRIVVLSDDEAETNDLKGQLDPFGYAIERIADPAELKATVESRETPYVLIRTRLTEDNTARYEAAESLADLTPEPRILYLSDDASLAARISAIRAAGSAFITVPFNGFDVVDRLESLGGLGNGSPYRVLIVDDDRTISKYHEAVLNEVGITCRIVDDPATLLTHLAEFRPELILMDYYMPDIDGRELAAAIRQQPAYDSLPIVFLSAEDNADMQQRVMRIGGDDFLTKPISPPHLAGSVLVRARRFRSLRATMVRDSLTGLLNHTAIKEQTAVCLSRMRRQKSPMVFGIVDIDHFKKVNDTHGHPVGDQVIRSLSHLLKQRLRTTDVVGRYGGEEFAVVLPDTPLEGGALVMDRIRAHFEGIAHPSAHGNFSATFSCGVAAFPAHDDPEAITQAADEALYAAKRGGRNQVRTAG
jgi:diguanylate cyclase (GGDEF)-like protein